MDRLFGRAAALTLLLWLIAFITPSVSAHHPRALHRHDEPPLNRRALADGVDLRILPLGDSITWGYGSSDGNGYRQQLRTKLSGGGNAVTFVGSQVSGSMPNGNNEGHSGAVISEIAAFFNSAGALRARPNVVLLLAGTNDMNRPFEPSTAPDRLDGLVKLILDSASGGDKPLLVVGKLPPNSNPSANSRTVTYNSAVDALVRKYQGDGRRVVAADMYDALTLGVDLGDGLHPNDGGYAKMADVWYAALAEAAGRGWIDKPAAAPDNGNGAAACKGSLYWDPVYGQVASGVGSGDPTKFPSGKWWDRGTVHKGHGKDLKGKGFVHVADLNGDGKDDYVWVDSKSGAVALYLNTGDFGNWDDVGTVASGIGAGEGVRFADIDGDGKADYLWIDSNEGIANVRYYRNGGRGSDGKWIWYDEGVIFSGENIIFADLDGDGRADIALRRDAGALVGYLNVGPGVKPKFRLMGDIASGDGGDDPRVELRDLNGDGRADYLHVKEDGSITAYINMLGEKLNAVPSWLPLGSIAGGVAKRENVIFGDLDGDGKTDYIVVNQETGAITLWQNQGSGSAYRAGHNVFLADLNGDGKDDYLIVSPGGAIDVYMNGGVSGTKWIWHSQGQIASGVGKRANIRFGDLDGDGKDDYLVVDAETSAVRFWQNGGRQSDGKWLWIDRGVVASGAGLGVGKGVRFADLNGDGKVDYIYLHRDGKATAFLNGGACDSCDGGWLWLPQGRIADGVGVRREDIHFADIDGDGMADYLVVDPLNGAVTMYRNGGPGSSKWIWYPIEKPIATGVNYNGYAIRFADLNGDGRAEYLGLSMGNAALRMWHNACAGNPNDGGGGPDGPILVNPIGDEWTKIECTNKVIVDAGKDPKVRWNGVLAWQAWDAAIANWKDDHNNLEFSQEMSNFFNGRENMNCHDTSDHNGCTAFLQCDNTNHPAGYMILNSMVGLNNIILNMYDAIVREQADMMASVDTIQKTFGVFPKTSYVFNLILDLVGFTFAVGGAPVWNKLFKRIAYFKEHAEDLDTLRDTVNGIVSNGVTIIKDIRKPQTPEDMNNALTESVKEVSTMWYESLDTLQNQLFNGSDPSIATLDNLFEDGKLLQNGYDALDDQEIREIMSKALFAMLIPQAWALSHDTGVVVVDAQAPCGTSDPLDEDDLSKDDAEKSMVCHDDRMYYLIAARGEERECWISNPGGPTPHWDCLSKPFKLPPGMDSIDGEEWSGLTKEDFVKGAVNTFKASGKNGGSPADTEVDKDIIDKIQEMDVQAPGVVHIPVCTIQEARKNWAAVFDGSPPNDNYPCDG